jgi:hypothetical protein
MTYNSPLSDPIEGAEEHRDELAGLVSNTIVEVMD